MRKIRINADGSKTVFASAQSQPGREITVAIAQVPAGVDERTIRAVAAAAESGCSTKAQRAQAVQKALVEQLGATPKGGDIVRQIRRF